MSGRLRSMIAPTLSKNVTFARLTFREQTWQLDREVDADEYARDKERETLQCRWGSRCDRGQSEMRSAVLAASCEPCSRPAQKELLVNDFSGHVEHPPASRRDSREEAAHLSPSDEIMRLDFEVAGCNRYLHRAEALLDQAMRILHKVKDTL